ncbi:MAG: NAD-dependent epimerase [Bacteroidales bacterium]|nr:NAD-dependent epimerase [Bacteroidales bacterium]
MDSDMLKSNTILVTGTAGFIGFHLAKNLLERGDTVIGIDNINDYYDVNLKLDRLADTGISENCLDWHKPTKSEIYPSYTFVRMNLEDREELFQLFKDYKIDKVCNLAAQAGVRYSIENPFAYIDSNIVGFSNILEACRHNNIKHLVYASSSSVYGNNTKMPLSTNDNVDHPISLYAATKKSNELMAHTYSHLFGIPTTGLRFFTVYGPWGRPDMALFLFTKAIKEGNPIKVFNNGNMVRDFTYVADIVEGVVRVLDNPAKISNDNKEPSRSNTAPYKVYNIGNSSPVQLMDYIKAVEVSLEKNAKKDFLPIQPGDVPVTNADVEDLIVDLGYKPNTDINFGVAQFVDWFNDYYK